MNPLSELPRAILFDLDGTMVDTLPDIAAAANAMLDELGAPGIHADAVRAFIGDGVPALVRRVLKSAGVPDAAARNALDIYYRHYHRTNGRGSSVYPAVPEVLAELRRSGYRLGCVTNKPIAFTLPLLESTGLHTFFGTVVAGDTLARRKPDPEPLRHACRELGTIAARGVLVGDSAADAAAASAAGMPVYIVRYGYAGPGGHAALACTGLIASFDELPALLAPA